MNSIMGFNLSNKVWKKDETAALIALFETERCLYDSSDREFHDPEKKAEAYERICKIMLRIRPDVSVEEIRYKIKVLRKQYEGELLHRNISIETGLCTKDSYKPGMWCFGLLQFLDDYLTVKRVEEISKIDEDSDKETYNTAETDHQKEAEESSDVIDDSDDHEEIEERISCKKKKAETSSSSSERESLNSSIIKFLNSTSKKKLQNNSFSFKKFQSSSSLEKKFQNSSSSAQKLHSNPPSEKKFQKTPSLVKKSRDTSSSFKKFQSTSSSQKRILNSSPSLKKLHSTLPSEKKVPSFSKFEKDKKKSSSERELKNCSFEKESKDSPEKKLKSQPSPETVVRNSLAAAKETKINSLEKELFNTPYSGKEFEVIEKVSGQIAVDREDIFGRYVASELRALRCNPLLYLQTKQSILENLTSANFELINPE